MKKKYKIAIISLISLLIIMLIALIVVVCLSLKKEKYYSEREPFSCVLEQSKNQKLELYFDYKNGEIYRYTIISTNPMTAEINIDEYNKFIANSNNKYKGATSKFWHNDEKYVITEYYELNYLTEKELKELTGMSLKELKTKTKKELKDYIIPFSKAESIFTCQ